MLFTFGLSIQEFLLLVFLVVFLFYAIYSGFLIYHWHSFGYTKKTNSLATLTYLIGSGVLIFVMAISALTI